jgi:ankyrin repeat protein
MQNTPNTPLIERFNSSTSSSSEEEDDWWGNLTPASPHGTRVLPSMKSRSEEFDGESLSVTCSQADNDASEHESTASKPTYRQASPGPASARKRSPLADAAEHDYFDKADRLITQGADINEADSEGHTALHRAARNGHLSIVDLLLRNKANPEARTRVGYTPLMLAAVHKHAAVAECLLSERGDGGIDGGADDGVASQRDSPLLNQPPNSTNVYSYPVRAGDLRAPNKMSFSKCASK